MPDALHFIFMKTFTISPYTYYLIMETVISEAYNLCVF